METREFKVYKFNEIKDEKTKKEKLDKFRNIIIDNNFDTLEDSLLDILQEKYDIKNARIFYILSYCQGDGLRFEHDDILSSEYFMNLVKKQLTKSEKIQFTNLLKKYYLYFKSVHGGNCHYEYCTEYDIISDCNSYNLTEKQEQLIEKIEKIIADEYVDICGELERIGYDCYNVSDNDILDFLEINDISFANINGVYVEV